MKVFWIVFRISIVLSALAFLLVLLRDERRRRQEYRRMLEIQRRITSGEYGTMPEFDAKSGEDARRI